LLKDLDGSLTADGSTAVSYMPYNLGVENSETCERSNIQNAWVCRDMNWSLLTFESGDLDTLTRLISPVYVRGEESTFSNKLNSYMDHVWDGFYTGLKRLSRFHSVIENGQSYSVSYTGTIPNLMRYQLQGASNEDDFVILSKQYTKPQSIKVTADGQTVPAYYQRPDNSVTIQDEDGCGANIYDPDNRIITFKATADCMINTEVMNAIKGSVRYDIDINEFFN